MAKGFDMEVVGEALAQTAGAVVGVWAAGLPQISTYMQNQFLSFSLGPVATVGQFVLAGAGVLLVNMFLLNR